jgi:hypothetical protein
MGTLNDDGEENMPGGEVVQRDGAFRFEEGFDG